MSTINFLDRFLTPVSDAFTPELAQAVLQIQIDEELQEHVERLAIKASDGTLTTEEDAEYKALIDAADLISILQLKARGFLAKSSS
ncbi:hypothetical protein [Rubinisphaera margarita]|uniref:hypothetical protein n=1 Tax=Rubinisphaera margarita TaxID=2909586 RepID=UPI001EE8C9F5|nr:hypothetical protein [Rubinisphaera margarita]MCG6155739.1 hypothetical protein [Rubinisphaera margarita]